MTNVQLQKPKSKIYMTPEIELNNPFQDLIQVETPAAEDLTAAYRH